MNTFFRLLIICVIFYFSISTITNAQPNQIMNSAEIQAALEKLNTLGSVLYIGAHPDDENTGLIAYLSKGKKYRTAYLSLTRGDGGQNLIGPEKGSAIGIIRTQELLEARKIDGGEQFFTRAVDFGYSKSANESLDIWNKDSVLSDMVWIIRNFKPDIIITRFPFNGGGGHGHHVASSLLTKEAFTAAADPNRFPEQLKYVKTWAPKRLFWNNWQPGPNEVKELLSVDVGDFNPLLGKSYSEVAAESRSMHKSQGFGTSPTRGSRIEYFQFITGEPPVKDIFDGINTTWDRIKSGEAAGSKIKDIINSFSLENPSASLDKLVDLYKDLNKLESNYWLDVKKNELLKIIRSCAGLWMEATASDYSVSPGDEIKITANIINRTANNFKLTKIELPTLNTNSSVGNNLEDNKPYTLEKKIRIPDNYPVSQPYWLIGQPSKGLFKVPGEQYIGLAENPPCIPVKIILNYNGEPLEYTIPVIYRWNDKVLGELYRPFEVRPAATVNFSNEVAVFPDNDPKEVQIRLKSNSEKLNGEISLIAGGNWKISPSNIPFSLTNKYDEQLINFKVTPPHSSDEVVLKAEITIDGKRINNSLFEISYPHIKRQVYFPPSEIKLTKLDLKKFNNNIGYIMGSGDEIPDCLRSIGYSVTVLTDEMLEKSDLSQYDVIITGIRAYNTRDRLKFYEPKLLDFVDNGGTLITQYNVLSGLTINNIGPYPLKIGNGRISTEDAPIKFLVPDHQLLNFPNKISQDDFKGWVQERGLYFADEWDKNYQPIFSGSDPNEEKLIGSTLFAKYGKGIFIYSAFSWFRQLPAGVPGAYRLFVNMISSGMYDEKYSNKQ